MTRGDESIVQPSARERVTPGVDESLLRAHRGYEDPVAGIAEEFAQPLFGGARTVAVLSRPRSRPADVGWVICHSFGLEQIHLGRAEVMVARALAAAGFPVLRYHGRGYGDSGGDMRAISLSSHLRDAADAVSFLRDEAGVSAVGALGMRFGAMVAALVADRAQLPFLALWDPVTSGSRFVRDFLRSQVYAEMLETPDSAASRVQELRQRLAEEGWVDLRGFPLSRTASDEIAAVDLSRDLERFRGSALVLGLSHTDRPERRVRDLAARLEVLGGRVRHDVVQHVLAGRFGQQAFANDGLDRKRDIQLEVTRLLLDRTLGWATAEASPRPVPAEADG